MKTSCPQCGAHTWSIRRTATRLSSVLGGLAGLAAAWRLSRSPESLIGAMASGLVLGASLGAAIDEEVLREFVCGQCGHGTSD